VVDTTSDVSDVGAPCTLREAVVSATGDAAGGNGCANGSGPDVVSFDPAVFVPGGTPSTIDLSFQQLFLNTDVTIAGPGTSELLIDGAPGERTIFAGQDKVITLSGLTVTGGNRTGTGNEAGGGIFNAATLTLTEVTVSGNQVRRIASPTSFLTAKGGGIHNSPTGTLTLNESVIRDNAASASNTQGDSGGAEAYGGGIFNDGGTVQIHYSVVDGNQTLAADTGAVSSNVQSFGAGIHSQPGSINIDHSQITRNDAAASGGTNAFVAAQGAGIAKALGAWRIEQTTIAGNTVAATGGAGSVITQSGGGIYNGAGTLDLVSDTIARNGPSAPGVAANIVGGGATSFANTIVSDPLGAGSVNCGTGPKTTGGTNVDYSAADTPSCGFGPTDLTSNPLLAAGFTGGPTETIALLPGSPAIDAGSNASQSVLNDDQRGLLRPVDFTGLANAGNGTDIGAFEVQKACPEQTAPGGTCPQPVINPQPLINPPTSSLPPAGSTTGPTGQRAAALKKCKKKRSAKARKRCKKKAKLLPV